MNIILFGYQRCGKTYFGKRLAELLSRPFIDTDRLIEEEYFDRKGERLSIREIHIQLGNEAFRILEGQTLHGLQNVQNSIISVGGGMVLEPKNCQFLKELGELVYLIIDKETLKKRIFSGILPSYLDQTDPEGSFEKMYAHRKKIYEKIRATHVALTGKTYEMTLDELRAIIKEKEHGQ